MSFLADLLFPRLCAVCGCGLTGGERFICTACLADFPLSDNVFTLLRDDLAIWGEEIHPESLWSLFYYDKHSHYKKLIYSVKYHSKKELGFYLGRMLGEKMAGKCTADCIIPIPLHKKRERQRGFNQSYIIAQGMAEVMRIEVVNDVLFRVRNNVSQTGKNAEERQENVQNIFQLHNPGKIEGCHVLLVDDVITTGATVRECLKLLAEVPGIKYSIASLGRTGD